MSAQVTVDDTSNSPNPIRPNATMLLVASAIAGIVGGIIVDQIAKSMVLPDEFKEIPFNASSEYMARYHKAFTGLMTTKTMVVAAVAGGLLGVACGLGGADRKKGLTAAASGLGGLVTGAIGGYLLGLATAYCMLHDLKQGVNLMGITIEPIILTSGMQFGLWASIGIVIGVAWAVVAKAAKSIAAGIEGGILGGALASLLYTITATVAFPTANAFAMVPESSAERITWIALCSISVAAGLLFSLSKRAKAVPQVTPEVA